MIPENLVLLRSAIAHARAESPLAAQSVHLIGACKGQPEARIREALAAGLADFGENRVQEAQERWEALPRPARLHLIGPLQTNKVREAVALFDIIHSVDRERLAEALAMEMGRQGRRVECFVQVNTGEEAQKAGVPPHEADALIARCRMLGLPVVGLMCVPPAGVPPAPHFALLRKIALHNGLARLSVGMSSDFEMAVRMGATHVRIGTALFGERQTASR